MNNTTEPVTATMMKEMMNGTNETALVRYPDGSLGVIRHLSLELPDIPDDVEVLRYPAKPWAGDLIKAAREVARKDGKSEHLATLKKKAIEWANDEIKEDEKRMGFRIPPDMMGARSLSRTEMRIWMEIIERLIPLMP